MNTWKVNNFNDSTIIGRVVPTPSFIKILLSEYGVVSLYDRKKEFRYLSWANSIISLMVIFPLIFISIIFLLEFIKSLDISTNESISALVVFSFIIFHCFINIVFYLLGFFRKKNIYIEKKLNFDTLIANTIIRVATIIIIFLFIIPSLEIDPLLPITSTEISISLFLIKIIYFILSLLIFICSFHLVLVVLTQIFKMKTVNMRIKELMIEATSINDTSLPIELDKKNVNKIIFKEREKN